MNNKTNKIVLNGLMISLVCIATIAIQIPVPGTNGYVNIGDSMIFIASILLGPFTGMIAGGIGSALADILSGYSHWAIFTLIIKGFEGYIVGVIIKKHSSLIINILGTIVGSFAMILGYFIAGIIINGSVVISFSSIPSNMVQAIMSILIALPISYSLSNVKYIKSLRYN